MILEGKRANLTNVTQAETTESLVQTAFEGIAIR